MQQIKYTYTRDKQWDNQREVFKLKAVISQCGIRFNNEIFDKPI